MLRTKILVVFLPSKKKFSPRMFTFKLKASESKYSMKRFRIVMDRNKQEIHGKNPIMQGQNIFDRQSFFSYSGLTQNEFLRILILK